MVTLCARCSRPRFRRRRHEPRYAIVRISLVILPGASGRDIARQIAVMRPSIRVLNMSGYTDEAIVRHGVLEPGLAFFQKPLSGDALARWG